MTIYDVIMMILFMLVVFSWLFFVFYSFMGDGFIKVLDLNLLKKGKTFEI